MMQFTMTQLADQIMTIDLLQSWLACRNIQVSKTLLRDLCVEAQKSQARRGSAAPLLPCDASISVMSLAPVLDVIKIGANERGVWLISRRSAEHFFTAYRLLQPQRHTRRAVACHDDDK